jgi:hypothetical protein
MPKRINSCEQFEGREIRPEVTKGRLDRINRIFRIDDFVKSGLLHAAPLYLVYEVWPLWEWLPAFVADPAIAVGLRWRRRQLLRRSRLQPRFSRRSQGCFGEVGSSRQDAAPTENKVQLSCKVTPARIFLPFSLQPKHLRHYAL